MYGLRMAIKTLTPALLALIDTADIAALRAALVASLSVDVNDDLLTHDNFPNWDDDDCGHSMSCVDWTDRDDQIAVITTALGG